MKFKYLIPAIIVGLAIAGATYGQVSSPNYWRKSGAVLSPLTPTDTVSSSQMRVASATIASLRDAGGTLYVTSSAAGGPTTTIFKGSGDWTWTASGTGLTMATSVGNVTFTWVNPGYITTSTGLGTANFATASISQWTNNSGYITTSTYNVAAQTCGGTDKVSAISSTGTITCSTDQTGAGGGGVTSINTATGTVTIAPTTTPSVYGQGNSRLVIATTSATGLMIDTRFDFDRYVNAGFWSVGNGFSTRGGVTVSTGGTASQAYTAGLPMMYYAPANVNRFTSTTVIAATAAICVPIFECSVSFTVRTTSSYPAVFNFWGFHDTAASASSTTSLVTANASHVGLFWQSSTLQAAEPVQLISKSGGAAAVLASTTFSVASNTVYYVQVFFQTTSSNPNATTTSAEWYVNGSKIGSISGGMITDYANIPSFLARTYNVVTSTALVGTHVGGLNALQRWAPKWTTGAR